MSVVDGAVEFLLRFGAEFRRVASWGDLDDGKMTMMIVSTRYLVMLSAEYNAVYFVEGSLRFAVNDPS